MSYFKPSKVQGGTIPHVMGNPDKNYLIQALNGSGKTGAFAVPSLMKVDTSINKPQVIILANTRELIRQTYDVLNTLASETSVKLSLGEAGNVDLTAHILITVPGYLKNKL